MEPNRIRDRPEGEATEGRAPKWHPMLFSAPMIRAIREGRKTVTRRLIKPQPTACPHPHCSELAGLCREMVHPYSAGDLLWVREAFASFDTRSPRHACSPRDAAFVVLRDGTQIYRDGVICPALPTYEDGAFDGIRWRPAIHMPRWASRDSLEVLSVRAERLLEITGPEITAEGAVERPHHVEGLGCCPVSVFDGKVYPDLLSLWRAGWDSINGKRAPSSANPWVWRIEFRRVT